VANAGQVCGSFGTCHCDKIIDCTGACIDDPGCLCCGTVPC
jgi:hypothetical protein